MVVMVMVVVMTFCCFPVIDLSLDVIVDLAHHPNIIGVKESGGDVSDLFFLSYIGDIFCHQ